MKKVTAGLAALALAVGVIGVQASAASDLSFGVGYSVKRGAPGSTVDIGGQSVPGDLVGRTCDVSLTTENNESIHPGNDVIISSASSVTFKNVESQVEAKSYPAKEITLGSELDADLRFGQNGVTSSGFQVTVDCPPPPTTIPPTTEPPVTTAPPTSEPPTTEPPTTKPPKKEHPPTTLPPAQPAPPVPGEPTFTG